MKNGTPVLLDDGKEIQSENVCEPADEPRSYAYCSDTAYSEKVTGFVTGVSTLYHESTFLENEKERAKTTFHSTAIQAATVALNAQVGQLILGHYSSRYNDDDEFLLEAKTVFQNVELATEGKVIQIGPAVVSNEESDEEELSY